jgi:Pyridoxal-phosphate dependent enzyme
MADGEHDVVGFLAHAHVRVVEPAAAVPFAAARRLDLAGFTAAMPDRATLSDRPPTLWRFAEALPVGEPPDISMGEEMTPLLTIPDHPGLALKADYLMPTGSFKDRGAALLVALARGLKVTRTVADSSGNAGAAIAAYAAGGHGLRCLRPRGDPGGKAGPATPVTSTTRSSCTADLPGRPARPSSPRDRRMKRPSGLAVSGQRGRLRKRNYLSSHANNQSHNGYREPFVTELDPLAAAVRIQRNDHFEMRPFAPFCLLFSGFIYG